MEARPTGVAYAAAYQMRALVQQARDLDLRLVATRPRGGSDLLADCRDAFTRRTVLPLAGLARYYLWSWLDWPPIEWFSGEVDLAHNPSHQVPSTRNALRVVTIHDLSFIRVPETHTPRNVRIQTALIEQCVRRADAFVAVSESCKHELMDVFNIPTEKIYHVPNGVCLDEFPPNHDPEALAALESRLGLAPPYFIHLGTVDDHRTRALGQPGGHEHEEIPMSSRRDEHLIGVQPPLAGQFLGQRRMVADRKVQELLDRHRPEPLRIRGAHATQHEGDLVPGGTRLGPSPLEVVDGIEGIHRSRLALRRRGIESRRRRSRERGY